MIDRSKIVRIFCNKSNKFKCIVCDGIINRRNQKDCPPFLQDSYACLCKYSNDRIIFDSNVGDLFNNTTDKIISTIYNCGHTIDQCHVQNCNECNLKIVIDKFKGV